MRKFRLLTRSIILFLILLIIIFIVSFLDGYFGNRVNLYLEQRLTLISEEKITKIVNEYVLSSLENEEIILWQEKDGNAQIEIKTAVINKILVAVTEKIVSSVKQNEQDIDLELPLGIILSETLFNHGPGFNIEAYPVGTVDSDIVTSVEEYGINNSLFRLDIVITMDYLVLVPLANRHVISVSKIPLVIQMVQGKTPLLYSSS